MSRHLITLAVDAQGGGVVYLDGKELDTTAIRIEAVAGRTPLVTLALRAAVQGTVQAEEVEVVERPVGGEDATR